MPQDSLNDFAPKLNCLEIPVILYRVGQYVQTRAWEPIFTSGAHAWKFHPKYLVPCLQVCHLWYNTLAPLLWTIFYPEFFNRIPEHVLDRQFLLSRHYTIRFLEMTRSVEKRGYLHMRNEWRRSNKFISFPTPHQSQDLVDDNQSKYAYHVDTNLKQGRMTATARGEEYLKHRQLKVESRQQFAIEILKRHPIQQLKWFGDGRSLSSLSSPLADIATTSRRHLTGLCLEGWSDPEKSWNNNNNKDDDNALRRILEAVSDSLTSLELHSIEVMGGNEYQLLGLVLPHVRHLVLTLHSRQQQALVESVIACCPNATSWVFCLQRSSNPHLVLLPGSHSIHHPTGAFNNSNNDSTRTSSTNTIDLFQIQHLSLNLMHLTQDILHSIISSNYFVRTLTKLEINLRALDRPTDNSSSIHPETGEITTPRSQTPPCQPRLLEILVHCRSLKTFIYCPFWAKAVTLSNVLLRKPWGCLDLEVLSIYGYQAANLQSKVGKLDRHSQQNPAPGGWYPRPTQRTVAQRRNADRFRTPFVRRLFRHLLPMTNLREVYFWDVEYVRQEFGSDDTTTTNTMPWFDPDLV